MNEKYKVLDLFHEFAAPPQSYNSELQLYGDYETVRCYLVDKDEEIRPKDSLLPAIFDHFRQTISHRTWIERAFRLVDRSGSFPACLREKLLLRVKNHDLSKFSSIEVFGYSTKFCCSEKEKEKKTKGRGKRLCNIILRTMTTTLSFLTSSKCPT